MGIKMTLRRTVVNWLDEHRPSILTAARYYLHVRIRGDIVYPQITKVLFKRLGANRATAIDVGANVGIFSRYLSSYFASVIAIEPTPYLAKKLEKTLPLNCKIEAVALGDHNGKITLRVPVDASGSEMHALSTAAQSNSLSMIENAGFIERNVPMRQLDEIATSVEKLVFVKIDVEGFEGAVLAGATKVLSQTRPVIQLEIGKAHNPNYRDVLKLFETHKYSVFAMQKNGLYKDAESYIQAQPIVVSNEQAALPDGCWDYLFVPEERQEELAWCAADGPLAETCI
jgi:FkbM family methyltransferase